MRLKKHQTTGSTDLFRARLDQIINLKHELAQLADKIDWDWIDGCCCSNIFYGLSDEGVCERWVYDPYFQVVSRIFRTLVWAERHPSLAHAVMAPLIC